MHVYGNRLAWMKVKCSRDGVADVNVILNRAGGACNGRKSWNTADLFAGVSSCFLWAVEDVRKCLALCVWCSFVTANTFKATMSGSLHDQLLIHSRLVQPGGCSCTQRVVGFVATNACFLANSTDGSSWWIVSQWCSREPTCWCWMAWRLQIKGICWTVCWHEGKVALEQPHKAALWTVLICMMNDHLLLHFLSTQSPWVIFDTHVCSLCIWDMVFLLPFLWPQGVNLNCLCSLPLRKGK